MKQCMRGPCRPDSPQVSGADSPAVDLDIAVDPSHLSKDGLPMIDADTFSKLLAEVSQQFWSVPACPSQ